MEFFNLIKLFIEFIFFKIDDVHMFFWEFDFELITDYHEKDQKTNKMYGHCPFH